MVAAAAATGILSLCGSPALADSHADGAAKNSPGVASGNAVQVPVDVPVNACGNTVDVVAALNPAFGNECENSSDEQTGGSVKHGAPHGDDGTDPGGGYGGGDGEDVRVPSGASADGAAVGSPGVGSGNHAQVPVDVPVNLCGNTVDVIAALNPVFGNSCDNQAEEPRATARRSRRRPRRRRPTRRSRRPPRKRSPRRPARRSPRRPPARRRPRRPPRWEQPPVLAETGSEAAMPAARPPVPR